MNFTPEQLEDLVEALEFTVDFTQNEDDDSPYYGLHQRTVGLLEAIKSNWR